jgi:acyl carrier protein
MSSPQVFEGVQEVFRKIFNDPKLEITREYTSDDIEGWDSLTHLNLIMAVQKEFNVNFSLGELQTLHSAGDLIDLIEKKL